MEEKRYKLESYNEAFCEIHDTKLDEWYLRKDLIVDLLNQQLKRIKELENDIVNYKYISSRGSELLKVNQNQDQQIAELQEKVEQLQKKLAIEELEKVKEKFGYKHNAQLVVSSRYLCDFIDNQIKELRGEMREKK